jgi:hypothetical protein
MAIKSKEGKPEFWTRKTEGTEVRADQLSRFL